MPAMLAASVRHVAASPLQQRLSVLAASQMKPFEETQIVVTGPPGPGNVNPSDCGPETMSSPRPRLVPRFVSKQGALATWAMAGALSSIVVAIVRRSVGMVVPRVGTQKLALLMPERAAPLSGSTCLAQSHGMPRADSAHLRYAEPRLRRAGAKAPCRGAFGKRNTAGGTVPIPAFPGRRSPRAPPRATIRQASCIAARPRIIVNPDATQAQPAARYGSSDFQALAETLSSLIALIRGGKIIYANPAACQLLGYPRQWFADRDFWEVVHPDDRARAIARGRARAAGLPQPKRVRERLVHADGHVIWMDYSIDVVMFEGQPTTLVTGHDVTEQRRIEQQLERSEARLAEAQRIGNIGSWEWDILGDKIEWSDELCRIYGTGPSEFGTSLQNYPKLV